MLSTYFASFVAFLKIFTKKCNQIISVIPIPLPVAIMILRLITEFSLSDSLNVYATLAKSVLC